MKNLYRVIFSCSSTSPVIVLYLIRNKMWINNLCFISLCIYLGAIVVLAALCIVLSKVLRDSSVEREVSQISVVTMDYTVLFLGCFFVAFSIPENSLNVLLIVFIILNVFLFRSQSIYFNPMLLLLRYNFYSVETKAGTKIYIITKKRNIKSIKNIRFNHLKQINEFTYLDKEKSNESSFSKSER